MEGASVRAIADNLQSLKNLTIESVSGNTKTPKENLLGQEITKIYSVGKRLMIETQNGAIVIHFLMYGGYRINKQRAGMTPRVSLKPDGQGLHFYNCSVKLLSPRELDAFEIESDILSHLYDRGRALSVITRDNGIIVDLLLDQNVFTGVGNIIKHEALFEAKIHPANISEHIPPRKVYGLIKQLIVFLNKFYAVTRAEGRMKQIFSVYRMEICKTCGSKIYWKRTKNKKRMCFYCAVCQRRY